MYLRRRDDPIYSWDNLQDDGVWVLATLDRFYSFLVWSKKFFPCFAL